MCHCKQYNLNRWFEIGWMIVPQWFSHGWSQSFQNFYCNYNSFLANGLWPILSQPIYQCYKLCPSGLKMPMWMSKKEVGKALKKLKRYMRVKKQRDRKCHASQATQWRSVIAIKLTLLRKICSLLRLFLLHFVPLLFMFFWGKKSMFGHVFLQIDHVAIPNYKLALHCFVKAAFLDWQSH